MPHFPIFVVDSFAEERFLGNQAAVCLLEKELPDEKYQKIAAELNLSETAFPLPLDYTGPIDLRNQQRFSLRWFTPKKEVPLCGHATLAAAHIIFKELGNTNSSLVFVTLSGELVVTCSPSNNALDMNFPKYDIVDLKHDEFGSLFNQTNDEECIATGVAAANVIAGDHKWLHLSLAPKAGKLIVVLSPKTSRSDFEAIKVDAQRLLETDVTGRFLRGVMLTLKPENPIEQGYGKEVDYVSRYFAPWVGIDEDPATGSSQCALTPFWARKLGRDGPFLALQCYPGRGAEFIVELDEDRVKISGNAITIIRGTIEL